MKRTNWIWILSGLMIIFLNACTPDNQQQSQIDKQVLDSTYLAKGQAITSTVFATLSREVSKNMQEGGVAQTVPYCQLNAYPITDSLSKQFGAFIKRTSHKIRNPLNTPDSLERKVLDDYLADKAKQLPLVIHTSEKESRYFSPILLAAPCMKCHGNIEQDISHEKYAIIQNLYPEDQAIGFAAGDLRGIWSVTFNR